ncbi:hypothetical protein ACNOYE_24560 [Nannocystaceae bacterium ST9]
MDRDWSLIVGHQPGVLGLVLIAACVGLALLDVLSLVRRPPPAALGRRGRARILGVLVLRLAAIACLLAVVFEVQLRVRSYAGSARRVVVLIDRSTSMDIADGPAGAAPGRETTRRWTRTQTLWSEGEAARERWRGEGVDVEVRSFGERTDPLTRASADALDFEPDAAASELAPALLELAEAGGTRSREEGPPLAGVVVISDGLVARDAATREHLRALAGQLDVPITTIATAGPTLRDVSLTRLHVGEFAFVENVTEFAVELVAHGLAGERASVSLLRDGELVEEQTLRLGDDGESRTIRFEVAPDRTGAFVYEFRVTPLAGEASTANNRRSFVIKVLRDKVRVLHVAGRPDWDVRALRTLLKRDPNVELLSYYILRDWEDLSREDEDAPLSLIAFPTDELFREQLGSFDLIVMHNFDAQAHGDYLSNVAEYLREGGALVVIGGDLGVATGDFAEPALAELLPIDLRGRIGLEREPFSPALTDAGRRHPISAWLAASGRADWSGLPALDSFNPTTMARDGGAIGATALLVHPDTGAPLLAVAEPGKGRVMALTTGSSWRLGFAPDLPLIDGSRPYDLLWLGAVRWLLRDASAERLVLETSKVEYALAEPVELSVRTLSASYAPEPDVEVDYEIRALDPEQADRDPLAEGRLTTDALGRASARIDALPAGAYAAEAWRAAEPRPTSEDAESGGAARRVFLVGAGSPELAEVDGDPGTALLRELAEASPGGESFEAIEGEGLPDELAMADLDQLARPATGRRDVALWDGWIALLALIGCFGGEWVLRRRLGAR